MMDRSRPARRLRRGLVLVLAAGLLAACGGGGGGTPVAEGDPAAGRPVFQDTCAACHGEDLRGSSTGPPLIHEYYVPSHHSDASIELAIKRGVQPHHWHFGPMPAWPSLTDQEIADVIAYVRQQQREAGLIE